MKDRSVYSNAKVSDILKQGAIVSEEPKHVRKSRSSTSRSDKRSDHKHEYEKVILHTIVGYRWRERCRICGKFQLHPSPGSIQWKDFVRPEYRDSTRYSKEIFLSFDEICRKFPGVLIFEEKIDKQKHKLYIVEVKP